MKRFLLIGAIGAAVLSMMCIGLVVLGLLVTPVRAQVGQLVERAMDRANNPFQRSEVRGAPVPLQAQPQAEEGILIAGVRQGGPAEQAGLRRGDILLEVDGQAVNNLRELEVALADKSEGDEVSLDFQRGDEQQSATATLGELQQGIPMQGHSTLRLGITACETGQFMPGPDGFGMPFQAEPGMRITQVVGGSPADEAGLQRGDILLSLEGEPLDQPTALVEALQAYQPGDSVTLQVANVSGEQREVTVALGEHPEQEGRPYLGIRTTVNSMRLNPEGTPPWMPGPNDGLPPDHPPMPGLPFPPGDLVSGALIQEVIEDSPAADSGLGVGQIIQAIDGIELTTAEALRESIAGREPGDAVTLTVFDPQTGESSEVEVTLDENPESPGSPWLGIRFAFLNINSEPEAQPGG